MTRRVPGGGVILAVLIGAALTLAAVAAVAQPNTNCAPREVAVKLLTEQWGETRRSVMLSSGERMYEVFAADESGTWTILRTTADGMSCVMAAGVAYERIVVPEGDPA